MSISKRSFKGIYVLYIKAFFDFLAALISILLLGPLLLTVFVILYFHFSKNPIFKQNRIGKNGKPFMLLKFRTFRIDDNYNSISGLGGFLRRTSIDELPQLLNILAGKMSFIGPRPLLPEYKEFYSATEWKRHEVKPGLTGHAQIKLGSSPDWEARFNCDLEYIHRISFLFDLSIALRTILFLLSKNNNLNANEEVARFDQYVKNK